MFRPQAFLHRHTRHIITSALQRHPGRSYAKTTPFPGTQLPLSSHSPSTTATQLRLLLLGSPGSGKGTQSAWIQREFRIRAITSGDLLRRNIAAGTEIGKLANTKMANGEFVSDDIMISLINTELQKISQANWLLDGFPRNIQQARSLNAELERSGHPLNTVINLVVPEEVILQRIMDRWVHIPSGRVYNLSYNPPRVSGLDDLTGEKLSKRDDDNPEIFRRRLQQHHLLTEPLLEYYDNKGVLVEIAGHTSDEIYPQIQQILMEGFGLIKNDMIEKVIWDEQKMVAGELA